MVVKSAGPVVLLDEPSDPPRYADRITLSVVIPAYNEVRTAEVLLRRVRKVPLNLEVIVVDDGSTDGTRPLLEGLRDEGLVDRLIFHEVNRGKGAALQTAFREATGDVVVVEDRVLFFWHMVGNRFLTLLSNMLTDLNLTDMETCYKMVRRELLQSLPLSADRFGIEPELTARLAQSGARIYEVPISYHGRSYEEGKKINWRDGVAALWYIARSNLGGPRPPRWTPTAVISIESEASRPGIGSGHQEEPASPGTSEAP
jgi:glycosyltransferase involved in cell wall biosynthesis